MKCKKAMIFNNDKDFKSYRFVLLSWFLGGRTFIGGVLFMVGIPLWI